MGCLTDGTGRWKHRCGLTMPPGDSYFAPWVCTTQGLFDLLHDHNLPKFWQHHYAEELKLRGQNLTTFVA